MGIFSPSAANFNVGETALLEQLINLILNPETTKDERAALTTAKKALEQKTSVAKVVNDLLNELMPAAVGLKMSPEMKSFYSKLYTNRSALKALETGAAGSTLLFSLFG